MSADFPIDGVRAGRDTTAINRARGSFVGVDAVWVFGYGSLIHKVDFPFVERRRASIGGWSRRFWQGSHDHRGTPSHPGRVVTLVPDAGATCAGVGYRIAPTTFHQLDVREKNGYLRVPVAMRFDDGACVDGVAYIAPAGNAAWLGPADVTEIACHIAGSSGPSGSNRDYVLKLAEALRRLDSDDSHVFAVEAELRKLVDTG